MLLILVGAVLPLLIAPGLFFHYDTTPKTLLLELCAILVLARPQTSARAVEALWNRTSGRWLVILAALQILVFALAAAVSDRPWFGLLGSSWRQFGLVSIAALMIVIVAVAGELCLDPAKIRTLLRTIAISAALAATYGILQYFDIDPFQNGAGYHDHAGDSVIVRPPGTLGHADYYGWWLAVAFFCALALAKIETARWRTAAFSAAGLLALAVVLSGTRAALLALIVGAMFTGLRPTRRHITVAVAILAGVGLFAASPAGTRLRARIQWSLEEPLGGARPLLWRDSLQMALAKPLLGFGPEVFPATFPAFQSEDLARIYPDVHQESPHNLALDAFTSAGLPGLLLILAWAALVVRTSRRLSPLLAALVASATAGFFTAAMLPPLLLSALALALLIAAEPALPPTSSGPRSKLIWLATLPALLFAMHAVTLTAAEFELVRFRQTPNPATWQAALSRALPGAGEDLFASRALATACGKRLECATLATQAASRATRTADDPANAFYNLAIFAAQMGDVNGTSSALRQASQLAPHWFKPHWTRARLLLLQGDRPGALNEATLAARLANGRYPEVIETLRQLEK